MLLRFYEYVFRLSRPAYTLQFSSIKAVEVASPTATFELVVKTEMGKGSTIPKGRYNLPRETKPQSKDRILVFAEGRQAEDAKRAGADIVGGLELVEGVRSSYPPCPPYL